MSREDLAEMLVEMLGLTYTTDTTFEVVGSIPSTQPYVPEDNLKPRDWPSIFENAKLKKGVTGKTIDGVYTGRDPQP